MINSGSRGNLRELSCIISNMYSICSKALYGIEFPHDCVIITVIYQLCVSVCRRWLRVPGKEKMKIAYYALRPFDELPMVKKYSEKYGYDYVWTTEYPSDSNLKLAEGCDAVSFTPCEIPTSFIDAWHECGVGHILLRSIGFDHVPMEYMKKYGMTTTAVTYPPDCVANYAVMLILMEIRNMKEIMYRSMVQDFTLKGKMGRDMTELTIGVIGTGHIGAAVIRNLSGFGCRILTHSRRERDEIKKYAEYVDMDTLFAQSDVITIHTASNQDTYHMINSDTIAKMKDGVIIVNTARGAVIDTRALIAGLKSKKVGGAALDVLEDEQNLYYVNRMGDVIDNDELNILRSFPNVICSPHTAFYTETTVRNMIEKGYIALSSYEKGETNPFEVHS